MESQALYWVFIQCLELYVTVYVFMQYTPGIWNFTHLIQNVGISAK